MKHFEIAFTLHGPGGTIIAPNTTNPIACESMDALLDQIASNFPEFGFGVEVIGISVKEVKSDELLP